MDDKNKKIIIIAAAIGVLGMIGSGYGVYLWQSKVINDLKDQHNNEVSEIQEQTIELNKAKKEMEDKDPEVVTKEVVKEVAADAVISYEAITEVNIKDDLKNKVANPYIDYIKETESAERSIVSITFSTSDSGIYTYSASAVHKNGGNSGWLLAQGGVIEWWTPDCMGTCTFSDAYKAKYPTVVEKYNDMMGL